jgi:acetylornithine/N-succinyldiaminopimelate aminotransferase
MNHHQSGLRPFFFRHLAQTTPDPPALEISDANGCYLFDISGKKYLDFISGIAVSSAGHKNQDIARAVKEQVDKFSHVMVFGEYVLSPQVQLARKLSEMLPSPLSSVYLTNSGAEAVEGAMKLAKRFTGRSKFIAFRNAYHGSTQGALSLMGNEFFKQSFRPLLPDVHFIEFNNVDDLKFIDKHTAAVFAEPIQSETGYIPATPDFMQKLREKCSQEGALLVLDEAQSGFGRTGKMFGFEHFTIIPDILILAKALGGGFPLGAFVASKAMTDTLSFDPPLGHITTFGGHPVSCAAALAFIGFIQTQGFAEAISEKESLFKNHLKNYAENITGKGLMLALHLNDEQQCLRALEKCMKSGLLADWFLFAPMQSGLLHH